ncbi:MAG: DEAD/DEAH box helicase [Myxococcota bacterium]
MSALSAEAVTTGLLQATWTGNHLFLWSRSTELQVALAELPGLPVGRPQRRPIAIRRSRTTWSLTEGIELGIGEVTSLLGGLANDAPVSDTLRTYSLATKLALELGARKRVVPTLIQANARWVCVLSDPADRERFEGIHRSLPVVGRVPVAESAKLPPVAASATVRSFMDAVVDRIYRQGAYAGPARGWALDFAQALRGDEPRFTIRDARAQATPDRIVAWAQRAEAPVPRVGLRLELPDKASPERFPLRIVLHRPGDPHTSLPVDAAWDAGKSVRIGGDELFHPAESTLRGLARAARLYPPLAESLAGDRPRDLLLDASQTWAFLDTGRIALEAGGIGVVLPEEFAHAGRQRIRARIRLGLVGERKLALDDLLTYKWEVLVGESVLTGAEFTGLLANNRPIVRWRGDWVFLDPVELARLPQDLSAIGRMKAPDALRAILTGHHNGVPVVADERLTTLFDALREPPELPPPDGLVATLRPYQGRGYAWLAALGALGLGALLADDMGLGKTVQLVTYLLARRDAERPSLVVCPTSVLGNWQRELARFAPELKVVRWHGLEREERSLDGANVVLTTYGLMVRDAARLSNLTWDVVALDEAQNVKNPDSRRARAARQLSARHRVALTGTPVENRLDELWSVMEFLVPGLLGPRATFQRETAVRIERFGDPEAADRLRKTVSPFLLRRTKADPTIAADLPDKVEQREYCQLSDEQRQLYQEVVERSLATLSEVTDFERRGRVLAMLTSLKQICNHPFHFLKRADPAADPTLPGRSGKLDRLTELIEQIASCNERVVLFTQYREMGELLQAHIEAVLGEPVPFLHGGTPATARDELVRRFQSDDDFAPTALIVSLKAGGTGLNLTNATHVIHFDRWWNPAIEDQATDRAHRIGQLRTVLVHKLVCEGTLEEKIDALLDEKRELLDVVVGSGERWVTELDDDALRDLVLLSPGSDR